LTDWNFGGAAGVVDISLSLGEFTGSSFTGVAGSFGASFTPLRKLFPKRDEVDGCGGLERSSLADPSPLKEEPSLKPLPENSPWGFSGGGGCGVGVASSRSRFCASSESPISDSFVDDAKEEV
jgi:hypothetical protein